ncbi:lipid droplet-regulating VLDL assembly factor AUP1 isoform X9 [Rhincodon typus]|uniref:lipid droplet-regulating VLDL assembly factor AUP1 isoform X9 n=1 Tax=Rhincodon typus TaxID=259920 RepID=UPI00202DCBEA|nr:lipid droplet-regulating VLDL assembly factor AUP1 isoform X9 [Rhincodon typus]
MERPRVQQLLEFRRVIVRAMCTILGVIVLQRGSRHRDKNIKIYISNHITQFDHNILNFLTPCHTPLLEGHSGFVSWARGYLELGWLDNRTRLAEALKHYSCLDGARGLLLFPEDETTNGKVGLLKFSSWPFTIDSIVQPLVLTVKRPFVSVNVVESSWVTELLWMFFIPFTVYQVRWLPSMSQMDEESEEDFTVRVQEHLATELGVLSTQHTKSDKVEYLKRMKHMAPQATVSVNTKCVDTTITNLLEGRVQFTPEEVSVSPSSISLSNKPHLAPCKLVTPLKKTPKDAPTTKPVAKMRFEKSPVDRHQSLQERKEALYAYARRRYIEKHGLQLETEESQAEEP